LRGPAPIRARVALQSTDVKKLTVMAVVSPACGGAKRTSGRNKSEVLVDHGNAHSPWD